jgi:hypothetical protein
MMTNNNFQVFKGGGGDEIIAPQMGTCDEISRILSFKRHVKKQTRSEKSAKLCKQQSLPEP